MTIQELSAFIADTTNKLHFTRSIDDVKIEIYFRPSSLLKEMENNNIKQQTEAINRVFDSCYYFVVILSKSGQELEAYYASSINNSNFSIVDISYNMKNYIYVLTPEKRKIFPADILYPRLYGSSGKSTFLTAFWRKDLEKLNAIEFVVKDPGLGIPNQKFRFLSSDIENLPQLKNY